MKSVKDERPPFLKSWRNVYIFILAQLAIVILLLAYFKNRFGG